MGPLWHGTQASGANRSKDEGLDRIREACKERQYIPYLLLVDVQSFKFAMCCASQLASHTEGNPCRFSVPRP